MSAFSSASFLTLCHFYELTRGAEHIINEPKDVVHDSLVGLTYTNPDVSLVESSNVVILNDIDSERVHVICGGGSGHEVRFLRPSLSFLLGHEHAWAVCVCLRVSAGRPACPAREYSSAREGLS